MLCPILQDECSVVVYSLLLLDPRSFNFQTLKLSCYGPPISLAHPSCPSLRFPHPQLLRQATRAGCRHHWSSGTMDRCSHPICVSFFRPSGSLHISKPLRSPRTPHHYACRKLNNPPSPFIKQSSLFSFWTTNSLLSCLCFSKVLLISLLKQLSPLGFTF